jgi:beta-lactamase class A
VPSPRLVLLTAATAALVVAAFRAPGEAEAMLAPPTPVAPVATVARTSPLATAQGIRAAQRYARTRAGTVAFAVLDGEGRMRGLNRTVQFPSASVVKAMLMVSVLRRVGTGHLDGPRPGR